MHSISTIFAISAALLSSTTALPAPAPLAARSCQITYPTSMIEFTPKETPSSSLTDFCLSSDTRVKHVNFAAIPPNARGACQLEFFFPAGYSVGGGAARQVNVFKTERAASLNDTWESQPKTVTTFGTVNLNSDPAGDSKLVVNSGSCESMRHFKLALADTRLDASVTFTQSVPPASVVAGLRIVHSC